MKIFISWSGELSKNIAEILKKKLPLIIQTLKPFVSATDIEKGENWDVRLTTELADTKFCIVCLTQQNVTAPWVHFEAGAISQKFEKRVSALMIGLKPSDLQGPLARFQGTKVEKDDFLLLVESINKSSDNPLDNELLKRAFDIIWSDLETEINESVAQDKASDAKKPKKETDGTSRAIEEILSLVRRQNSVLTSPEKLVPAAYLREIIGDANISGRIGTISTQRLFMLILEILKWLERVLEHRSYLITNDNQELMSVSEIESMLNLIEDSSRMFGLGQRDNIDVRISRLKIIVADLIEGNIREKKERSVGAFSDFLGKWEKEQLDAERLMKAKALFEDKPQN